MLENKNSKLEETLKKLAEDTSKANTQTSSNTESFSSQNKSLPGDPDCPKCEGVGYLRTDLPIDHPDFGKMRNCNCRQEQITLHTRERLFKLSNLDELSHLTFENFNPRGRIGESPFQAASLEQAFNQAQHFSNSLSGWLLLQGDYGCGKTHLAAAIANYVVDLGLPTLFITVPDLLDSLRFAYQSPEFTFEERFEEIRQADMLVLDDFGTQNATQWAQEKLFQIINYRYINNLPLVVTTNLSIQDIEERIRSRLTDPELVTPVRILSSDYRNPTRDQGHHKLSSLDQFPKMSFATFDLRKTEGLSPQDLRSLEKAYEAARSYADNPQGWIVFMGSSFTGKTHLAVAIGKYIADVHMPPLFVGVPDLLDHLRATFNPKSTVSLDRRFEEVRTAPLLILDDLGTESASPWAREKLYQLFNYRYNGEMPTVITTTTALEEMDQRLRSRMMDRRLCRIYGLTVPPFSGIIPNKSGR